MFKRTQKIWHKHFLSHAMLLFKNNHTESVIITDSERYILFTNEVFTNSTGYSANEVLGKTPKFLQGILTDKDSSKKLNTAIQNKESITIELINYRKNGSPFWNSFSITPYFNPLGKLLYWIGIQRNITQQRQLEQELLEAKNKAEQLAFTKSQFLANMSHEIRTPMNSILGFSELSQESNDLSEIKQYLANINRASSHLMAILNDILDLSKIQAEGFTLNKKPFYLKNLLDSIQLLYPTTGRNFTLEANCNLNNPSLPFLIGDELRLKQVLINLLNNAFKFSPHGSVKLIVDCEKTNVSGTRFIQLKFAIVDTGIGISEEQLKSIFKRFTQADSSISRNFGGTGLGLAISQQLIQSMGGEIQVQSTLGKGSTFSFELPLEISNDAIKNPSLNTDIEQLTLYDNSVFPNKRILVVDDDKMSQVVTKLMLKKLDFGFEVAENGAIAIDLINKKRFDLVLMDIQMPIMNGLQATHNIRKSHTEQDLPIIGMSAGILLHDQMVCFNAGMNSFLLKPLDFESLKNELVKLLS